MTTTEIANRLVDLCRTGEYTKVYEELYADDCVSIEMPGSPFQDAHGMKAIHEKGKRWNEMVEEFHGGSVGDPIVADTHFACTMSMDVTMKGQPRSNSTQLCVYHVKDEKIVKEQFYYQTT